jgi:hypothetical protein
MVAKVLSTIEENAKLGGAARAMGLTASQFTGIAAVARNAGEDTREFIESLVTMGKVIDDGMAGRGEVAPEFFRTIGVEAKAFAGLRIDQQFFKIFESLEKMQDPAKRVRALMVAFDEDGGKALLNALGQSTAEMRRFAAQAAISDEKMKEMEATAKKMREAQRGWDKATTDLAIGSAPAVQAAADATPYLITFFRRVIAQVHIGNANVMNAGARGVQLVGFDETARGMRAAAQKNLDAGWRTWYGTPAAQFQPDMLPPEVAPSPPPPAPADPPGGINGLVISGLLKPLWAEGERRFRDFEARRKAFDGIAGMRRASLGPAPGPVDRLRLDAELLQRQFDLKLIDRDGFLGGMGKLVADLDGVMGEHEVRLPAAMLKGSQEAESLLSRTISSEGKKDPAKEVKTAIDRLTAKQMSKEEMERAMGRAMSDALEKHMQIVMAR